MEDPADCKSPLFELEEKLLDVSQDEPPSVPEPFIEPRVDTLPMATLGKSSQINKQSLVGDSLLDPANPRKRKDYNKHSELESHFDGLKTNLDDHELDVFMLSQHKPSTEPLPNDALFHPSFAEAERMIHQLFDKLLSACRLKVNSNRHSTYIERRLAAARIPAYSGPYVVGLQGNTAAGKSTLTNAILGVLDLSPESGTDIGTCVPLEYSKAPEGQPTRFAGTVELLSLDECKKLVKSFVKDVWTHIQEENDADLSSNDLLEPVKRALCAVFRGYDAFKTMDDAGDFLEKVTSAEDPEILSQLFEWTEEVHIRIRRALGEGSILASTTDELHEKLSRFILPGFCEDTSVDTDDEDNDAANFLAWPFVKRTRISLVHRSLPPGLVLVDLAGVSDSNQNIVRVTKNYLRKCDMTAVVGPTERAESSDAIKSGLIDAYRRKRTGVALILTKKLDKITGKERNLPFELREQDQLKFLGQCRTDLKAQKSSLVQGKKGALPNGEIVEDWDSKIMQSEILSKHVEAKRKGIYVGARQRQAEEKLRSFYRSKTKHAELPIFSVDAQSYLAQLCPHSPMSDPHALPIDQTGLVQLRKYIFSLATRKERKEILNHHCGTVARATLNALSLFCTGFQPMMQKDQLQNFITRTQKEMEGKVNLICQSLYNKRVKPILRDFDKLEDNWLRSAAKRCDKWSEWAPTSFMAFVRHKGTWKTMKYGKANWNDELTMNIRDDIEGPLLELCDTECASIRSDLIEACDALNNMEHELRANLDPCSATEFREFFENIHASKKEARNCIAHFMVTLEDRMGTLTYDCLNNEISSPFCMAMSTIYEGTMRIKAQKGMRIHDARTRYFKEKVCKKQLGPFMQIRRHFQTQTEATITAERQELLKGFNEIFEKILHDFHQVCPEVEDLTPKSVAERAALAVDVEAARAELEGPIKQKLLECGINMDDKTSG